MKSKLKINKDSLIALIFILPALVPLLVFWVWPMIDSLYISFTDWDFMSPEFNYVGFKNYFNLFTDKNFYQVLFNTLYFSLGSVIPTVIGGLLLALLLN